MSLPNNEFSSKCEEWLDAVAQNIDQAQLLKKTSSLNFTLTIETVVPTLRPDRWRPRALFEYLFHGGTIREAPKHLYK